MGRPTLGAGGEATLVGALSRHHNPPLLNVHRSPVAFDPQEISGALGLKLPPDNDGAGHAADRPRTLGEIKNVVEFLVRMDELVWRRSEYGANRGVFDPENASAVEDRIRLWEKIARGHCSE